MAGKISSFFREYILIFSLILIIIGAIVLFLGIVTIWLQDFAIDMLNFPETMLVWNFYFLIGGFIILGIGSTYFYNYFKNRKYMLDELETNKRSELLKVHSKLKITAKKLPTKYQKMLKDKEEELKIK